MKMISAMALALAAATPVHAGEWEFILNPYLMLPNSSGKFGIGPFDTNVSASPSDLFSKLNWGFMGAVEANNGDWGFNLDVSYLNLDITDDSIRRVSVNGHQAAYTATVLKRVHQNAWVYAGIRWSDMGVRLTCNTVCAVPTGNAPGIAQRELSRNQDWQEVLVGFRANLPFNERLDLTMNADVGGFGAGSEVSINVWPQLGWRVSESSKALLGYRIVYVKHESEEGVRFLYDVVTFGPTIGFEYRF